MKRLAGELPGTPRRTARARRLRAMSAAGDILRAERKRFERELRHPDTTHTAGVGADDSAHFLADSPRTDDDAVWDLPGDETPSRASSNITTSWEVDMVLWVYNAAQGRIRLYG